MKVSVIRFCAVASLVFSFAGPAAPWTLIETQAGAESHPKLVRHFGGAYDDEDLAEYVSIIGDRLVSNSDRPREKWNFTILNSAKVNAYSLPGGYVYVTRGMLAAVNSEAELAGILAQEISSVILGNHGSNTTLEAILPGTVTQSPSVNLGELTGLEPVSNIRRPGGDDATRRSEEYEATLMSVRILVRAGYDANALGTVLENLLITRAFAERMQAQDHEPNVVTYFDTHRITAGRVDAAIREARKAGVRVEDSWATGVESYMQAVDGLIYGDSPDRGFVEEGEYLNPDHAYGMSLPENFKVQTGPTGIRAEGVGGALLVIERADGIGGRLDSHIRDTWAPALSRSVRAGYIYDLQTTQINGMPAASAFLPYDDAEGPKVAQLVVVRKGNQHFLISAMAAAEDIETSIRMSEAIETFRAIDLAEAIDLRPYRLMVYRVARGDSVNLLSAAMSMRHGAEDRFRAMNAYGKGRVPLVGDWVKIVSR